MTLDKRTFVIAELAIYSAELRYNSDQFRQVLTDASTHFNFTRPTEDELAELRTWIIWFDKVLREKYRELFGVDVPE